MKAKDESGVIMLESMYCVLACLFVTMLLVGMAFLFYQHVMVSVAANEIAAEVAQTYKLRDVEDSSSVTESDITGVGKYRYLLFKKRFNTKNEAKANRLMDTRLSAAELAERSGKLTVTVENVTDYIGRRHFKVTVKQEYSFLLGGFLKIIGRGDKEKMEKTVYVESVDALNYINTVKFYKYGIKALSDRALGDFAGALNSTLGLLRTIFGAS